VTRATVIPLALRIQRVQLDASAGVGRHDDVAPRSASVVFFAGVRGIRLSNDLDYERELLAAWNRSAG